MSQIFERAESQSTIFALSSGKLPAGIAVVRISGPKAGSVLSLMTGGRFPDPRQASLRKVFHPVSRETLDHALILWMPAPHTVTGEDMVELHLHGGRAVVAIVLDALSGLPEFANAEPGAFTRRAYENGKIDLSQVEGLGDLLVAETEVQRRSALALSEGALGWVVKAWRQRTLECAARVEATLDFADEGDVAETPDISALETLANDVRQLLDAPHAERLRDGVRVVLAGPPNVGKSTLLNVLTQRETAITSPIAGTTRDIIEASVVIRGVPYLFIDTAGLHEGTGDSIEKEGIRRAQAAQDQADIILWLGKPKDCISLSRSILIAPRADVWSDSEAEESQIAVSSVTGMGMDALYKELHSRAEALLPGPEVFAINKRQREFVAEFVDEIDCARATQDALLIAEHLRRACHALDRLVGRVGVEDMLDALFSGFCIGK